MNRVPLAVAFLLLASPALGHHGWSGYDSSQPLTLAGKIVESGYEHPHGHIRLDATGKIWFVVLAPPTRMANRGLPKEALKPGDGATVVGYPNRSKPEEVRAERITVQGKTVGLR
jgi:hypothetical protein